jgi:hypothetical protein
MIYSAWPSTEGLFLVWRGIILPVLGWPVCASDRFIGAVLSRFPTTASNPHPDSDFAHSGMHSGQPLNRIVGEGRANVFHRLERVSRDHARGSDVCSISLRRRTGIGLKIAPAFVRSKVRLRTGDSAATKLEQVVNIQSVNLDDFVLTDSRKILTIRTEC